MTAAGRLLFAGERDDPLVVVRSGFWSFNSIGVYSGDAACAIDPGITPAEIEMLERELRTRERGGVPRTRTDVVLTHSHHDHIRGWRRFPGARVIAPRVVAEKSEKARTRILAAKARVDELLDVDDPRFRYPEIDRVFDARMRLEVGELTVELRFLPGHSECTSVVLLPELRTLCSADYLVLPGMPYCRWRAREFEEALVTLARWCEEEGIERIIPAHEEPILGGVAIAAAIEEEQSYFRYLRESTRARISAGDSRESCARACAKELGRRRGRDLGGRARQDLDNARRVLAEEWPES